MSSGPIATLDVPILESGALIERLDAALLALGGPGSAVLATDGDGTLWTDDIGEALFHAILERGLIGPDARTPLHAEANAHGVSVSASDSGIDVARALFAAYLAGEFPEDRICAAMAWCAAGLRLEAIDMLSVEVLHGSFDLRRHLIRESAHVLQWAAQHALPVFLVSASPRAVVERAATMIATEYGITTPHVLAMTPRVDDGVICAEIEGTWTYGEGKVEALTNELAMGQRRLVAAMGDNAFDAAMLRSARVPIAIRPKPALVSVASSIPGLVRAAIVA